MGADAGRIAATGRRALGAVLLALLLLPWYRLVGGEALGPAAEQTLRLGGPYLFALWVGCALTAAAAVVLGWLVPARAGAALWGGLERALVAPRSVVFALGVGLAATAISAAVSAVVLLRRPILLDGVSQLLQARYFGAGMSAGPRLEDSAFWQFQFMVVTDSGWASQYPPGFPALLALAGSLIPLWLVGPLLLGGAVSLISLIAERLFPEDRLTARLGASLTALSSFLAFHAAGYMNHALALALVAAAMLATLRAAEGSLRWSLLAGVSVGVLFSTRPYTAVVLGFVATLVAWTVPRKRDEVGGDFGRDLGGLRAVRHLGLAALGAAPSVLATLLYNRRVFGALTRFGYVAGEGPGHALGFHADPWGNPYGPRAALGYTAADLQGLSLDILQSPIPVGVVVALYLLLVPRLTRGAAVACAWALLPVAAQTLYWHHDLFMGPRLLYESAPGWSLLFAAAVVAAWRGAPERSPSKLAVRRAGVAATFALGLAVALFYAAPAKLRSYRGIAERSGMAVTPPTVSGPSLVFVHGAWEDRLAARLAASGMRVDSIRLALRHSSSCRVELFLEGRERPASGGFPDLAFGSGAGAPPRTLTMPSGSVIRSYENEVLDPRCEREAASDFEGALGLPPLLWQGDLPGLGTDGAMFVRDLGPERNARLTGRFPERTPRLLLSRRGEVQLVSYAEGMRELWGGSAGP
jgi:hypothetical protein